MGTCKRRCVSPRVKGVDARTAIKSAPTGASSVQLRTGAISRRRLLTTAPKTDASSYSALRSRALIYAAIQVCVD